MKSTMQTRPACFALATIAALLSGHAAASDLRQQCAALGDYFDKGYTITESRFVAASTVAAEPKRFEDGADLPEHCLVRGSLGKRIGVGPDASAREYETRFELRMPISWNGRFLFEGGGVMDGVDWPAYGSLFGMLSPNGLTRGFAVVRTNSGHESPELDSSDGTFAYDQQAKIDYAFNALDKVTLSAKDIVSRYYGQAPDYNYFVGCSNGGRQGMLLSQRFPRYFDGIVSGNASFNISSVAARMVWSIKELREIAPKDTSGDSILSRAFSDADLERVQAAALSQCEMLDGLDDGLISDMQACDFDPSALQCESGDSRECISAAKLAVLDNLMTGPLDNSGVPLYRPIPYDSGFANSFRGLFLGGSDSAIGNSVIETLGLTTYRYHTLTPPNPDFDPADMDIHRALATDIRETRALNDAEATFMSTFAKSGKLLMYHGASDFSLAAFEVIDWYEQVGKSTPGELSDWARLFIVPGMEHCGGGRAFNQIDPLKAIVRWVENNEAPSQLPAAGSDFPDEVRPICAWPKAAQYQGGGEDGKGGEFVCE